MTTSRRDFFKQTGEALLVGFSLNTPVWNVIASAQDLTKTPPAKPVDPTELDSWLAVAADGNVTLYTGRIDMGTGAQTSFAQAIADELEVPFTAVNVIMGDTGLTPDQGKTTASSNSSRGLKPLLRAAAEARSFLLQLGSDWLGVSSAQLVVRDGVILDQQDPSKKVSYAELIGGKNFKKRLKLASDARDNWGSSLQGDAPLKNAGFRYVGKSIPRIDVPAKMTGTFRFVHDLRVPGMVHGRVVRPPAIGATLLDVDEGSVKTVPGVLKVVRKGNFLGVVAEREEQAIQAARQLKANWSGGVSLPEDKHEWLRNAKKLQPETDEKGDVDVALAHASKVVKATYKIPLQNHGMIGPSCAVADVSDGQVTFWSGSQWIQGNRRDLAGLLGIPVENVRGIWMEAAGSYGRLACDDAVADAALLSQAVGKPVRVQWMREDEHGWEPKSPAVLMECQAGLDANGKVTAFVLQGWTPSHSTAETGNQLAWRLVGGNPGHPRLSGGMETPLYRFQNEKVTTHYVEEFLRAIYLRGPGPYQHNFAVESFIDELALTAAVDPLEFRLRHLEDAKALSVLKAVTKEAGWQPRPARAKALSGSGTVAGRGICLASLEAARAAVVVDVEVNLGTGMIQVRKVVMAVVCGRIINPQGLRHQLQGGFIQGLSRSLMEEVKYEHDHVTTLNWSSYPILRFPEIPEIKTILIDEPAADPSGIGELASVPAGPAVANAVFDAVGVRLREIPFTPERVKAALAQGKTRS